jgi:hypothetical protein
MFQALRHYFNTGITNIYDRFLSHSLHFIILSCNHSMPYAQRRLGNWQLP